MLTEAKPVNITFESWHLKRMHHLFCYMTFFILFFNPPPRSGWGIIEMAFVCPSVNLSVRPSVSPTVTLSCPLHISWTLWKILLPLEGFSLNFGHMFASVRRCAKLITQPCPHKVKVTVQGHRFEPWISCQLCISWTLWKIFIKLWSNVRLSESMCRTHVNHANSRSRSQVKVIYLSLEFRVRSISPVPLEGFSLNFGHIFAPVRWCAELITQPCRHKVKITVQGHRSEPWISCSLCISYTSGRIFFKLWSNVYLSETMCRINNSTMPTQGQDHSSRSWVIALNFLTALYLLYPGEDFL